MWRGLRFVPRLLSLFLIQIASIDVTVPCRCSDQRLLVSSQHSGVLGSTMQVSSQMMKSVLAEHGEKTCCSALLVVAPTWWMATPLRRTVRSISQAQSLLRRIEVVFVCWLQVTAVLTQLDVSDSVSSFDSSSFTTSPLHDYRCEAFVDAPQSP